MTATHLSTTGLALHNGSRAGSGHQESPAHIGLVQDAFEPHFCRGRSTHAAHASSLAVTPCGPSTRLSHLTHLYGEIAALALQRSVTQACILDDSMCRLTSSSDPSVGLNVRSAPNNCISNVASKTEPAVLRRQTHLAYFLMNSKPIN